MKKFYSLITAIFLLNNGLAQAATMDEAVLDLQQQWAVVKYQTPSSQQKEAISKLADKAAEATKTHANKAEPMIWQAIILSTQAGIDGGLGALGKVKQARDLLLQAEKINPNALNGSVYTSLGSLYYKVPGWPVGFGDKKKAEEYLLKSLTMNPDGIDSNFFYGELLFEEKNYKKSSEILQKALNAPARPGRELADSGRKKEINELLTKVKAKLQ